jgi:outer membrane biosynthesis protein TonB
MDGALLVFDSRTLPNLHALAPVDLPAVPVAAKAHWRHRTFPAMAALILATVFSLVYFVSTQPGAAPPVNVPSVTLPASKLAAPVEANPTPEPPPPPVDNAVAPAAKEEAKPEARSTQPAPKGSSKATSKTSTTTTQPKPAEESKKDDSKVGSILKKTGRILKKPFKL